jgi:hypothetical protein
VAGTHGLRPVDLTLAASGNAFVPTASETGVSIGQNSSLGVGIGGAALRITLQGADVSGRLGPGNNVFFPEVATDTDASVVPTAGGAEIFAVLRSRLSPE